MTNDIQPNTTSSFGARLQAAREAQGLERRDAAAQLRLSEKVIAMMEKDRYAPDLPPTFIRGYLRAYSKILQIPEEDVNKAIELLNPKPVEENVAPQPAAGTQSLMESVTSGNYYMQFFTVVIVLTMVGLVGTWWHSHNATPSTLTAETQLALPDTASATVNTNASTTTTLASATPIQSPDNTAQNKAAQANNMAATAASAQTSEPSKQNPSSTKSAVSNTPANTTPSKHHRNQTDDDADDNGNDNDGNNND